MKLIKRVKRFWQLTKKDKKIINALDGLTDEQIMSLPDEDTKVQFLEDGNNEDFEEFQKEESGLKPFYDFIRNL